MAANTSGSWVTAFSASRLVAMAGVALDGAWTVPLGRGTVSLDGSTARSAAAASAQIRVITDDDAEPQSFFSYQLAPTRAHTVLSEELFRSALIRERKRADRFNQVFALLTVEVRERDTVGASLLLQSTVAAISAATRETDLVGWLEGGAAIGVMLPEIVAPARDVAGEVEGRIVRELASRLGDPTVAKLNLRLHVHSGLGTDGAQEVSSTDPLVSQIQSARERATVRESLKRALDVVCSLTLLVVLSPLLLLLAALVKLTSSGPVLFKQERIGEMARPFTILKFRSMQAKAASALHQQFVTDFIKSGGDGSRGGDAFFKIKSDPRITPIGHILRKTSLDELPQLWNVLRGDMSLVGPRPPLQYELDQYRSWHWRRVIEAKPGITGLWQVTGRSRTTFDEMVRLDLRYARSCSLWGDLKILLATPRAVIGGKGAC